MLRMPHHIGGHNLSGFRDPSRAFLVAASTSASSSRLCTVIGAGAHDCSRGGAKMLLYCTRDLTNLFEWRFVSELSSSFTRPRGEPLGAGARLDGVRSGGVSSGGDGCAGLVSCPDFFKLHAQSGLRLSLSLCMTLSPHLPHLSPRVTSRLPPSS